jgi:NADH-quinone oxidoreductase subunit G
MVKITIDGKQLEVDPGLTIIQAASQNGIHIPHFCWHPKLSVSGNCMRDTGCRWDDRKDEK